MIRALTGFFGGIYQKDKERIRSIERFFVYQFENYEFYRLRDVRERMIHHKYVEKKEFARGVDPEKEEMRWVFHVKPKKVRKFDRYWKPARKEEDTKQTITKNMLAAHLPLAST
eukprot:TRINITY_DN12793_c0_g1_i1.p2 TRINITY_DN12793_c0_g1~~TRINITY_DN12793_c0_g1_i1.p2  ORF type:complete len:114 (+),score=23.13 TRINITY_DN12793_c0_g1_i1:98-439(+)